MYEGFADSYKQMQAELVVVYYEELSRIKSFYEVIIARADDNFKEGAESLFGDEIVRLDKILLGLEMNSLGIFVKKEKDDHGNH